MNLITSKLKEVLFSVLPITILVFILNFTLTPLNSPTFFRFIIGAFLIIIGLTIFLIGVDVGITPIGNNMGRTITKSNKIWFVTIIGILLGFFISVAEPDLHILANQVRTVTSGGVSKNMIVLFVSLGFAIMLAIGLLRIVFNFALHKLFFIIYGGVLILSFFTTPEFLAISFDASGATTGALTVPFILSLAIGVSKMKKDSHASETDSFGLVGITSTGAIIGIMIMNLLSKTDELTGSLETTQLPSESIIIPFIKHLPTLACETAIALAPMLIIFIVFQIFSFKLSKISVTKILFGVSFSFIGLTLFLLGVNKGFMEVGSIIGYNLTTSYGNIYVIAIAFVLGMVTILAEPAVYVLVRQIEDVTSGYVKKKVVLVTLSIGIAIAVTLAVIRILVPSIQLWHYLLPGYIISIVLTFFVPKLFVGIAFDSGGVSSGPMTATFILAFTQGIAHAAEGANVLIDGFGVIAMVAMFPLITLQILGLIFKIKSKKGGLENE